MTWCLMISVEDFTQDRGQKLKKLKQTFLKQNRMKPRFNGVVKGLRPRKTDLFLKRQAVCPIRMANLSAGEIAGEFSDSCFAHNLVIDEKKIMSCLSKCSVLLLLRSRYCYYYCYYGVDIVVG